MGKLAGAVPPKAEVERATARKERRRRRGAVPPAVEVCPRCGFEVRLEHLSCERCDLDLSIARIQGSFPR